MENKIIGKMEFDTRVRACVSIVFLMAGIPGLCLGDFCLGDFLDVFIFSWGRLFGCFLLSLLKYMCGRCAAKNIFEFCEILSIKATTKGNRRDVLGCFWSFLTLLEVSGTNRFSRLHEVFQWLS